MDLQFIRERISILRTKKNVSEYRMSTDLGHSKSYIQSISSGRAMPSMSEFLYICEYLGVTPKEFFDIDSNKFNYSIAENYSEADVALEVSALAQYCADYDKTTGVLTIVVWAGDFETNTTNFNTYKITFKK